MTELTFMLEKGEKVISDVGRITYAGVGYVQSGSAIGTQFGNSGMGGGLFSSKQIKREGSIFDSKPSHAYLTNKRIVFCNAKISLFGGTEKEVSTPLSEISFNQIKGINHSSKLGCPAIDLSIASANGQIDNIKFWFTGASGGREGERDEFLHLIKKQCQN